jgi:CHAT domain-containing protein/tetratricopeptide (TPR) repeat protein
MVSVLSHSFEWSGISMIQVSFFFYLKNNFMMPDIKTKSLNVLLLCFCLFTVSLSCQPTPKPVTDQPDSNEHIRKLLNNAQKSWKSKAYKDCLEAYKLVYAQYEKVSPKRCVSIQQRIAACYVFLNQTREAESAYTKSLALAKTHYGQIHEKVATINHEMALFYMDQGRYVRAKEYIEVALGIDDFVYGPVLSPVKLNHLNTQALIYDHIGAFKKAQSIYERIYQTLKRQWGDNHLCTEAVKNNLGGIFFQQKDYIRAEKFYQEALKIAEKHKNDAPESYARTLNNIAVLYKTIDQHEMAESFYYSALNINKQVYGAYHVNVGAGLNNLAGLYIQTKDFEKASTHLGRAWIIAEMNAHLELLWRVQDSYRDLYAMKNQPNIAIFFGKQSVHTIQSIKKKNVGLDKKLMNRFLTSKTDVFRNLADLLIGEGRLDEAMFFLRMLKVKEYLDFMGKEVTRGSNLENPAIVVNSTEKKVQHEFDKLNKDAQQNLLPLEDEYHKAHQQYIALKNQLIQIKKSADTKEKIAQIKNKLKQVKKQKKKLAKRINQKFFSLRDKLIKELNTAFVTKPKDKYTQYQKDTAKDDELFDYAISHIVKFRRIDQPFVAIYFLKTPDKLSMILTNQDVSIAHETKISTQDLNAKIYNFRNKLIYRQPDYLNDAKELYDLIFAPIASSLDQFNVRNIMVSLDGALRYIPLAALHDGEKFVAEQYAISIYTPAAKDNILNEPKSKWQAAAMGVTKAIKGHSALPAVKNELDLIIKEDDPNDPTGILPGDVFIDNDFTLEIIEEYLGNEEISVMHIASHFDLVSGDIDASALLLGDGQLLSLKMLIDDYDNVFDFWNLDLLTLSACETAVSSEMHANGIEVESFATMVQKKGAKSVIATLWQVADDSTGIYMENFYKIYQNKDLTKIEALQQVQQMFIHEEITHTETYLASRGSNLVQQTSGTNQQSSRPEKKVEVYKHPFYWAPFILIGNWL